MKYQHLIIVVGIFAMAFGLRVGLALKQGIAHPVESATITCNAP